jgi:hypothetical protein
VFLKNQSKLFFGVILRVVKIPFGILWVKSLTYFEVQTKVFFGLPSIIFWRNGLLFFENQTNVSFGLPSIDGKPCGFRDEYTVIRLSDKSAHWRILLIIFGGSEWLGKFFNGPLACSSVIQGWNVGFGCWEAFSSAHWRNPPYVMRDSFGNLLWF